MIDSLHLTVFLSTARIWSVGPCWIEIAGGGLKLMFSNLLSLCSAGAGPDNGLESL